MTGQSEQLRVAAVMACHNRVDLTVRCLDVLQREAATASVQLRAFLFDDGSTDGTAETVMSRFPFVVVLEGDGTAYWNGGMHQAFGAALAEDYDHYLWLNDDTILHEGALLHLLDVYANVLSQGFPRSIVIPTICDPETRQQSYGGYKRIRRLNPLSFRLVPPANRIVECDTFCGNCVLIPRAVAKHVGNISSSYVHRWGDVDYGIRARKLGCRIWIAPGYLADCSHNPKADQWQDSNLGLRQRMSELHSLKGLGKKDWLQFCRQHGGGLWPVIWFLPYSKILLTHLSRRLFKNA